MISLKMESDCADRVVPVDAAIFTGHVYVKIGRRVVRMVNVGCLKMLFTAPLQQVFLFTFIHSIDTLAGS